ncbi:hypothetical protein [Occultella kanbiaonis]|uniref:hypothetical protein n=1 Tax=Occultella kanbiaonis TaxID=2675754 RepID=UPI0012B78F74|nr:hypothetical protein [Occultella kanbiaonis]
MGFRNPITTVTAQNATGTMTFGADQWDETTPGIVFTTVEGGEESPAGLAYGMDNRIAGGQWGPGILGLALVGPSGDTAQERTYVMITKNGRLSVRALSYTDNDDPVPVNHGMPATLSVGGGNVGMDPGGLGAPTLRADSTVAADGTLTAGSVTAGRADWQPAALTHHGFYHTTATINGVPPAWYLGDSDGARIVAAVGGAHQLTITAPGGATVDGDLEVTGSTTLAGLELAGGLDVAGALTLPGVTLMGDAGTDVLDIAALGGVTVNGAPIAGASTPLVYFEATSATGVKGTWVLPQSSFVTVPKALVTVDQGGGVWDPIANTYAVPVAGIYLVTASVRLWDDTTAGVARSTGHGADIANVDTAAGFAWRKMQATTGADRRDVFQFTRVMHCNAGDPLRQFIYSDARTFDVQASALSVLLLREDS